MSLIIFLGALVFVAYELFQVRTVSVLGCETISQKDIIALSEIQYDRCIFFLDKRQVMENLAADPGIKPVSVEITYPDKVTVTIEERHPKAYIENEGAVILIDKEGWVLEVKLSADDEIEYPQVLGLPADTVKVGERIGTDDTFKIEVLTRVLKTAEQKESALSSVDVSLAVDIAVTLDNGFTVELGDDMNLESKFDLAAAAIGELQQRGKTAGTLDVSSAKKAYYRDK